MVRKVVSRSQRRMEKKLALVLLVLVLAVSLVSFSLGVMVGRSGSKFPAPAPAVSASKRIPVAKAPPKAVPVEAPAPAVKKEAEAAPAAEAKELSFYDALPKGEAPPLGSGINLPPAKAEKAAAEPAVRTPVASKAVAAKAAAPPAPSPEPEYLVQVASFRLAADAGLLQGRLVKKGYRAFVREVDLGEKGAWNRVLVGPFVGAEAAGHIVDRLKVEEKLSALAKRR